MPRIYKSKLRTQNILNTCCKKLTTCQRFCGAWKQEGVSVKFPNLYLYTSLRMLKELLNKTITLKAFATDITTSSSLPSSSSSSSSSSFLHT